MKLNHIVRVNVFEREKMYKDHKSVHVTVYCQVLLRCKMTRTHLHDKTERTTKPRTTIVSKLLTAKTLDSEDLD